MGIRALLRQLPASVEWKPLLFLLAIFFAGYYAPVGTARFDAAVLESLHLVRYYAREHVLLSLLPALFIAGGIGEFVRREAVMRYLGPRAPKPVAYGTASVSGSVLAVCSCTILPLFAGIYRLGAGLGPAAAFLYAGPAINVMAVILTARILGVQMGVARAAAAIAFSIVIGLIMHLLHRREEGEKAAIPIPEACEACGAAPAGQPLHQVATCLAALVAILIFANWGEGDPGAAGFAPGKVRWLLTMAAAAVLALALVRWFGARPWKMGAAAAGVAAAALTMPQQPEIPFIIGVAGLTFTMMERDGQMAAWGRHTWGFAKEIVPPLFLGVLVAGLLFGRPGQEGLIPAGWVERAVGGNSLAATFFASIAGAFMYFATCTEIPILQGLMGAGMGKGPALALLLAGPAVSLPGMLVLRRIVGTRKTFEFIALVVVMSALCGFLFGSVG